MVINKNRRDKIYRKKKDEIWIVVELEISFIWIIYLFILN